MKILSAGKLLGIRLSGWVQGWKPGEAQLVGWLLQTKALIEIIFANVLLDRQVITADTFTALLLMAVGSTMLTTPMVRMLLARKGAGAAGHATMPGNPAGIGAIGVHG